jgi:hypothetical protein
MTLITVVREFFATPAGAAVVALLALAVLDFALGVFAAIRDDMFRLDAIAAWLRKHVAGRVLPTSAVLLIGHMTGGLSLQGGADLLSPGTILTTIGLGMAGTYVLEVIGSVRESLVARPDEQETFTDADGTVVTTLTFPRRIPQD